MPKTPLPKWGCKYVPTVLSWQKRKRGLELHSIDNFETSFFTSKVIIWLWYSYMMRCIPVEIHPLYDLWYLFQNIPTFHYLKSIDLMECSSLDHNPYIFHLGTTVVERKKLKTFYLFHTFLSCSLVDWLYIMLIFDFLSQPKDLVKINWKISKKWVWNI